MKRVLLVDDDDVFNFLSKRTLENLGFAHEVSIAANGREALRMFNGFYGTVKELPDVILLDINMPIMNGFEFLQAFRKLGIADIEKIKIVIVSSSPDPRDIAKAKELGVNQYLTKPLLADGLRMVLN